MNQPLAYVHPGAKIAKNIVKSRIDKKIVKVKDLVEIIEKSKKKNYSNKINPCTKTFQADLLL